MRLHEYQAASLFKNAGIQVPESRVASSPEEVGEASEDIGYPVMIKAQVLVGGRGREGGVVCAGTRDEAERSAGKMLKKNIKGMKVGKVLVSKKIEGEKELYLGVVVDGERGCPVVIASPEGGVSVEKKFGMTSMEVDPRVGLRPFEARGIAKNIGMKGKVMIAVGDILSRLYQVFEEYEGILAEINPLVLTPNGELWAVDAVIQLDDSALFRHRDISGGEEKNELEREAKTLGVSYVDLEGDIGVVASGAGLGMATIDIIRAQGHRPANFLETGGGMTEGLMYDVMKLVLKKDGLRGILINLYGGINPIHDGARGVVRALKESGKNIPVVAKALGNHQEEAWSTFRSGGIEVLDVFQTEKSVEALIGLIEENKNEYTTG